MRERPRRNPQSIDLSLRSKPPEILTPDPAAPRQKPDEIGF